MRGTYGSPCRETESEGSRQLGPLAHGRGVFPLPHPRAPSPHAWTPAFERCRTREGGRVLPGGDRRVEREPTCDLLRRPPAGGGRSAKSRSKVCAVLNSCVECRQATQSLTETPAGLGEPEPSRPYINILLGAPSSRVNHCLRHHLGRIRPSETIRSHQQHQRGGETSSRGALVPTSRFFFPPYIWRGFILWRGSLCQYEMH